MDGSESVEEREPEVGLEKRKEIEQAGTLHQFSYRFRVEQQFPLILPLFKILLSIDIGIVTFSG